MSAKGRKTNLVRRLKNGSVEPYSGYPLFTHQQRRGCAMAFENDLHDWYLDGVMLDASSITLHLRFYDRRKKVLFKGMTSCVMDNFLPQNVINEAKVITPIDDPDRFKEESSRLDRRYPYRKSTAESKILSIIGSVGAELTVDFTQMEMIDLP